MKLITIPFSHYADKARWALAHCGVAYREAAYMPFFHMPAVAMATRMRLGRRDAASSPFSTPLLVVAPGEVVHGSGEIARWAAARREGECAPLYPPDHDARIAEIERDLHDRLGPHTRRWGYHETMNAEPAAFAALLSNVGWAQRACFTALRPMLVPGLRRVLRISDASASRSLARVREVFDDYAPLVSERGFLVGDRFTAADLSLATMAAPILLIGRQEGYGATMPPLAEAPPSAASVVTELRQTPVGRFALRMYTEHRPPA